MGDERLGNRPERSALSRLRRCAHTCITCMFSHLSFGARKRFSQFAKKKSENELSRFQERASLRVQEVQDHAGRRLWQPIAPVLLESRMRGNFWVKFKLNIEFTERTNPMLHRLRSQLAVCIAFGLTDRHQLIRARIPARRDYRSCGNSPQSDTLRRHNASITAYNNSPSATAILYCPV